MIPVAEVPESDFWAALKPLYDLLNTTPLHQFADVGMVIDRDPDTMRMRVRFQHVVEEPLGEPYEPWPVVEVGEGEFAELAYDVDVVVVPEPGVDPVRVLWAADRPKGTPVHESGA